MVYKYIFLTEKEHKTAFNYRKVNTINRSHSACRPNVPLVTLNWTSHER